MAEIHFPHHNHDEFDPQAALNCLKEETQPLERRMKALHDILMGTSVDALMALHPLFEKTGGMALGVRQAIAIAFGEWGSESSTEALLACYNDEDEPKALRLLALQSLAKTRHAKALDALLKALQHEDNDVFGTASDALEHFGHDAMPELCMMLEQGADDVRCVAAWHIGKLKSNRGISSLLKALNETENDDVRALCVWALGQVGEARTEILQALKQFEGWEEPAVRIRAQDALTRLKRNLN